MIADLRDYALVPSFRSRFVERFEGLFQDVQERLGARMLGSFLDLDDPGGFVWLRAYPDLATRQRMLTEFYTDGELWKQHRDEVNGWIVDSDDVLLVRPLLTAEPSGGTSPVGMYTHVGPRPLEGGEAEALHAEVTAAVAAGGGRLLAWFATDPAENNYPRHPIRTGEHGFAWFAAFPSPPRLGLPEATAVERRLLPTGRSRMR